MTEEYEVFIDEEERPATKSNVIMCRAFEIKYGSSEGESFREEVQKLYDDRKEWQHKVDQFIAKKVKYKHRDDIPLTVNEMTDTKALMKVRETFIQRVGLKLGERKQKSLSEE